ncbi:MAG: hypothetical protein ACI4WX_01855 [Aristaeellaceae bacterium]
MSNMNHAALNALLEDKNFMVEMLSQETAEDVQALFKKNGVEFTLEEVREIGRHIEELSSAEEELTDAALESVSGGVVITAATAWAVAKAAIAVGSAGLAIYKWYKSR